MKPSKTAKKSPVKRKKAPVKPIIKKINADGTANIYFQYIYSYTPERKTLLDSGITILPEYWDANNLEIKKGCWENLPLKNAAVFSGC